jgi:type I restriction enzyme R subunit
MLAIELAHYPAFLQFEQAGSAANRYDVTILVNGLPLVQIELKKRGVAIREAFNQAVIARLI